MARQFNGTTQYLSNANAVVSGLPMSIAAWFYKDASSGASMVGVFNTAASSWRRMNVSSTNFLRANSNDGVTNVSASSAIAITLNAWQHGLAVFTSSTSRTVYLNGGNSGSNSTSVSPTGLNSTYIAVQNDAGTLSSYWNGRIAEAAIWDVSLTAGDAAMLAKGVSPIYIKPASLIAYWPLIRTDRDWVGGFDMTPTNSPTFIEHAPRAVYPLMLPRSWVIPPTFFPVVNLNPAALTLDGLPITISGGTPVVVIEPDPAVLTLTGLPVVRNPKLIPLSSATLTATGPAAQINQTVELDTARLRFRRIRLASPAAPFTGKKQLIIRLKGRMVVI